MPPPWLAGKDKSAPKGVAAVIVDSYAPKASKPMNEDKMMAAKALISAVQSGDPAQVVRAFETMFAICEMEPHAEYGEEMEDNGD